ncbi:hypothetical protein M233_10555 [Xylella fastidiosa subsp. multiplex Griffin-1]|nr:hypothetical protein M233_10555 [Xylella fastidiosa subsp. multiplex Griffin-1]
MIYGWLGAALAAKDNAAQTGTAEDISARMLRFPGGRGDDNHDPLHPDPGALPEHYFAGLTAEYFDKDAGRWIKPPRRAQRTPGHRRLRPLGHPGPRTQSRRHARITVGSPPSALPTDQRQPL